MTIMNLNFISIIIFIVLFLLSCNNLVQYYNHKYNNYYVDYFKFQKNGLHYNIMLMIISLVSLSLLIFL